MLAGMDPKETAERQQRAMSLGHWPICDAVLYADDGEPDELCNVDCASDPYTVGRRG